MEEAVISQLNQLHGVTEATQVHGMFDVIAKLEDTNKDHLRSTVARKIRNMPNVRASITLPINLDN